MELHLQGKTAVVTGASQGMGRAIAKGLAKEGVKVFATARNETLLRGLKEEIIHTGGVEPLIFVQDIMEPEGPANIAAAALQELGHVDILINNAGRSQPLEVAGDEAGWRASMGLDFDRPRQLTQHLLPLMMERREGVILHIASTYELRSVNASAVAKASLVVWSKQLATQLGPYGIRVNCLQPGLIDTENILRFFQGEARQQFAQREIPLGDFGEPEDIADMAVFLVSARARYITGSVAVVDGGMRHYPF